MRGVGFGLETWASRDRFVLFEPTVGLFVEVTLPLGCVLAGVGSCWCPVLGHRGSASADDVNVEAESQKTTTSGGPMTCENTSTG